jgi:hypothetical protein
MSPEELRQIITRVPFEPFALRTIDGRSIPVRQRDFILVTPTGRHTYVFQPDDSRVMLDVELIVGADFGPPPVETSPKPSDTAA